MDILKTYKISFSGLQIGHHEFDFQINDQFFESFEKSKVQQGNLALNVGMEKSETMLQLHFNFKGEVNVICDRCLDEFLFPMEFQELLIVKFGFEAHEESENILVIQSNDYEVVIAQYIYEYISVNLPMQLIHPDLENGESTCNQEFLKNFTIKEEDKKKDVMDPRWEALKKLK